MGVLYLVATPIGNLEDMTLRAIRILREVSLICTEDTRHSGRLLKHYQITTPMLSYHEHSDQRRRDEILDALEQGDVALISDAGMPGISDPGQDLVSAAIARGYTVSPIPGPSAITAAVPVSGLVPDGFLYLGFLPRRARERHALLQTLRHLPYPLVIYEAPHRLRALLDDVLDTLGDRPVALAREITKLHEEISRTAVSKAQAHLNDKAPRGEYVVVIGAPGETAHEVALDEQAIAVMLSERLDGGQPTSAIARDVARLTGLRRSQVYDLILTLKEKGQSRNDQPAKPE